MWRPGCRYPHTAGTDQLFVALEKNPCTALSRRQTGRQKRSVFRIKARFPILCKRERGGDAVASVAASVRVSAACW